MSTEPTPEPHALPADSTEQPDPVLGRLLAERYEVRELIARGGMARVYRARDTRLERDVAVKILSPPYAEDRAFTDRFLAEARAAASLSHPSLVHVYDSGSDGALHYIVMELLDRHRTLREILAERRRLGIAEAASLGRELLAGLRVVHERGLVHCDVKSANVMIGPGPAKLIDFGIARTPHAADEGDTSIGSLQYMSPEQLRGEGLTAASDLFALGVVLYEAITGQVPYPGGSPAELAEAHAADRVRPPSTLADGVPGRLDAAILQALRRDPDGRFRSAAAMDRALEASVEARDEEETRIVAPPPRAESSGYVPPAAPSAPPSHAPRPASPAGSGSAPR
ncbi:MAG: protein kinase domain-containing protein, partial [Thermoleophilaceae bacterium]